MIERRHQEHVYTLRFDNGPDQTVSAIGPTEAVAQRKGERIPYQITDETLVNRWLVAGRRQRAEERCRTALPSPVYADPDDAPVRRWSR
jgi:hypothetical protein